MIVEVYPNLIYIATRVNGSIVSRKYMFYTKAKAIAAFKRYIKELKQTNPYNL